MVLNDDGLDLLFRKARTQNGWLDRPVSDDTRDRRRSFHGCRVWRPRKHALRYNPLGLTSNRYSKRISRCRDSSHLTASSTTGLNRFELVSGSRCDPSGIDAFVNRAPIRRNTAADSWTRSSGTCGSMSLQPMNTGVPSKPPVISRCAGRTDQPAAERDNGGVSARVTRRELQARHAP